MSGALPRTAVVVGNPRPNSRTLGAALHLVREVVGTDPDLVVDLAVAGAEVLDPASVTVSTWVDQVQAADLVVVASPTYKATYTGLLKVFLDRFPADSIAGVAVPLMVGAGPEHALAAEHTLSPLLRHLGASVPTSALYVLDARWDDPTAYADWLERARPRLRRHLRPEPAVIG